LAGRSRIVLSRTPRNNPTRACNFLISNTAWEIIGKAWVQVANATLNFGIICQKKGVAYGFNL